MPHQPDESVVGVLHLKALADYGRLLDAMDAQRVALSAHQFRKAAVFALRLLRQAPAHPAVVSLCANSPALGELLEQVRFEHQPETRLAVLDGVLARIRA